MFEVHVSRRKEEGAENKRRKKGDAAGGLEETNWPDFFSAPPNFREFLGVLKEVKK